MGQEIHLIFHFFIFALYYTLSYAPSHSSLSPYHPTHLSFSHSFILSFLHSLYFILIHYMIFHSILPYFILSYSNLFCAILSYSNLIYYVLYHSILFFTRERWHNHLNPDINKSPWSEEEDRTILSTHSAMGNRWAELAKSLPGKYVNM